MLPRDYQDRFARTNFQREAHNKRRFYPKELSSSSSAYGPVYLERGLNIVHSSGAAALTGENGESILHSALCLLNSALRKVF